MPACAQMAQQIKALKVYRQLLQNELVTVSSEDEDGDKKVNVKTLEMILKVNKQLQALYSLRTSGMSFRQSNLNVE